jgi:hypothetical protein
MTKNRKGTLPILLDLHYRYPMNRFEEFYGYSVSYSEIEQTSYIDLKEMVFEKIDKDIKFRKFGREKRVLTVKMDITPSEYEEFLIIFKEEEVDELATNDVDRNPNGVVKYKRFNFLHDFTISNIRDLTNKERLRFKKAIVEEEDDSENDENYNNEDE